MGRHEDKAKTAGTYKTGGKEYVTISEAARRLNCSRYRIHYQVECGKIEYRNFSERGLIGKWLLWDKVKEFFDRMDAKKATWKTKDEEVNIKGFELGKGELPSIAKPMDGPPTLIDTEDPANSDCWKKTNTGIPIVDENGRHVIDYEKYKQKYDALIRRQQYEKESGRLLQKDVVDQALSRILSPLSSSIMQIPDRYSSRIVGLVESFFQTKLDNEQKTSLRALMEDEAESLVSTFARSVEEALDGFEE